MTFPRVLLLLGLLTSIALLASHVRWEARLERGDVVSSIVLEQSPLWSPPATPAHREFGNGARDGDALLAEGRAMPRLVIRWSFMLLDALVWLWGALGFASLIHVLTNGGRRDPVMRVASFAFLGLTAGALCSLAMWLTFGGWGPPMLGSLGVVGLLAGAATGVRSRRNAPQTPARPRRS